jgi:hypothetical protein
MAPESRNSSLLGNCFVKKILAEMNVKATTEELSFLSNLSVNTPC